LKKNDLAYHCAGVVAVKFWLRELQQQRCKNYSTSSLERFENKKKYFHLLRKNALAYYSAGVVVVNFKL
jgi:hypothetical protein